MGIGDTLPSFARSWLLRPVTAIAAQLLAGTESTHSARASACFFGAGAAERLTCRIETGQPAKPASRPAEQSSRSNAGKQRGVEVDDADMPIHDGVLARWPLVRWATA